MPKQKKGLKPDKSQRERFVETARNAEADESGIPFERALKKIVPPKSAKPSKSKSRPEQRK